jgi:hypothetical protein
MAHSKHLYSSEYVTMASAYFNIRLAAVSPPIVTLTEEKNQLLNHVDND